MAIVDSQLTDSGGDNTTANISCHQSIAILVTNIIYPFSYSQYYLEEEVTPVESYSRETAIAQRNDLQ